MDNIYELYFWANPQRSHNTGHSATGLFAIFSSPHFFPVVVLTSIFLLNYYHSTSIYVVSIWMSALVTPHGSLCFVLSARDVLFGHFTLTSNV